MKLRKKILNRLCAVLVCMCCGCGKEMITYEGDSGIYFPVVSQTMGIWGLSFADYHSDTLSVVNEFEIKLLGNVKDYERPVALEAVENDTLPARRGIDYEILDLHPVLKAGEEITRVRIRFFRTPELQENMKIVEFRLLANEHFSLLMPNYYDVSYTSMIVKLSEKIYQPWWWYRYGRDRFGRWTKTKGALICDLLNIPRADWNDMSGKVNTAYLTFACMYMYNYLEEQKKNGMPVYDEPLEEGGERPLMEMGILANPQ